jgi:hypothetical protein
MQNYVKRLAQSLRALIVAAKKSRISRGLIRWPMFARTVDAIFIHRTLYSNKLHLQKTMTKNHIVEVTEMLENTMQSKNDTSPCSLDSACKSARRKRLCWGLMNLSNWCVSRAESDACEATTMTMLERKTRELRSAVDKAGWSAIAEHSLHNAQDH